MIEEQLDKIVKELQDDVKEAIEKASKDVAKEGVAQLKSKSPKRTGEYARGWGQTKRDGQIIIHNKKKPGLPHLLEKGHALRNGGRSKPQKHIEPIDEVVKKELVDRIEKELK